MQVDDLHVGSPAGASMPDGPPVPRRHSELSGRISAPGEATATQRQVS